MTDEPVEVDLLRHNGVTGCLLQIQTCGTDEVSGGQEVFQRTTQVLIAALHNLAQEIPLECRVRELGTVVAVAPVSENRSERPNPLLQSLFKDHSIEESSEQDFLVGHSIRVIGGTVASDKSVQLADHKHDHLELVVILSLRHVLVAQVRQHNLAQELGTGVFIGHVGRDTKNGLELFSQVRPATGAGVHVVSFVCAQQKFNAVGHESVVNSLGRRVAN